MSSFYAPFTKFDNSKRLVWGIAQIQEDGPDTQGDIVDFDASVRAFKRWVGNIREMHNEDAVGKAVAVIPDYEKKQIIVGAYVSRGADDTWQKIKEGVLRGFSIGGKVISAKQQTINGKKCRVITDYELAELSLVDSPANPACVITAVEKNQRGNLIAKSILANGNRGSVPAKSLVQRRAYHLTTEGQK